MKQDACYSTAIAAEPRPNPTMRLRIAMKLMRTRGAFAPHTLQFVVVTPTW